MGLKTCVMAFLVRGRRPAFELTSEAAACAVIALGIWFVLVAPINSEFARSSADAPPLDWMVLRQQWKYTHAARALLQFAALALVVLSVIVGTPSESAYISEESETGSDRQPTLVPLR